MTPDFVHGILVSLIPSMSLVAWLMWRVPIELRVLTRLFTVLRLPPLLVWRPRILRNITRQRSVARQERALLWTTFRE